MLEQPTMLFVHTLLVSGDAYAGSIFAALLETVVDKPILRKNRGFSDAVLTEIALGNKSVAVEAIAQLLLDFYAAYPKRVRDGASEYLLLKSIVDGTWNDIKTKQATIGLKKLESKPVLQSSSPPLFNQSIGALSRSAPQQRARVTSVMLDVKMPDRVVNEKNDLASLQQGRPLPRIVKRQILNVIIATDSVPEKSTQVIDLKIDKSSDTELPKIKESLLKKSLSAMSVLKPKKVSIVDIVVKSEIVDALETRLIISGKEISFDSEAVSRFWGNFELLVSINKCSIDEFLAKIEMPNLFFRNLKLGVQKLTTAQVVRFAKGLGVTVERMLR